MQDHADKWTDEQLIKLGKKIAGEYRIALREMRAKQKKHLEAYSRERSQRLKGLDDTQEAKEAYERWLRSEATRIAYMTDMVSELERGLTQARQKAITHVNNLTPAIFAENANYAAFSVEKSLHVKTAFAIVDEATVVNLVKDNPQLLPAPRVDIPKERLWNRSQITNQVMQGILQGESIPDIAKRLQKVADMGFRKACGAGRLAVTGAENSGRIHSYERARDMGISIKKEWVATLDGRTRASHARIDGEKVDIDQKFSNGLRYPGDPYGPGEEIWGCRCTLAAVVDGFETDDAERWSKLPKGMSYDDWKSDRAR